MTAGLSSRWEKLFPERHIVLHGRGGERRIRLGRGTQLAVVAVICVGAAFVAQLATGYAAIDRLVAAKEAEVLQAEMSNQELRDLAIRLRTRLETVQTRLGATLVDANTIRGQLYTTEMRLRAVEEARETSLRLRDDALAKAAAEEEVIAARTGQIALLGRTLEAVRGELRQADAQRSTTMVRLHQAEAELRTLQAQLSQARTVAEVAEKRALVVGTERDRLRQRMADLAVAEPAQVARAESRETDAGAIAAREAPQHGWRDVERLLGSVGVDVERFLTRFGAVPAGQGGPFVAFDPRKSRPAVDDIPPDAMQSMLRSLPLAAPLTSYQLESRFGTRIDPFNGQKSLHTGLDFSAPFRSPVYNTAPGTVVHASGRGDYGRVVEIDHGSGIVTRYAHLHRITVAVGQRLTARQQIGLLGSTGRSSGPHVHYEILVNGAPQDPERFLKLGKTTLASAVR
jgi:murein DD-endopeptidase MepM/ murein hydrolase activator NlpD